MARPRPRSLVSNAYKNIGWSRIIVSTNSFRLHQQDRCYSKKKNGGGVTTYVNSLWAEKSEVAYIFSLCWTDCLVAQCRPRSSRHASTIKAYLYIASLACDTTLHLFGTVLAFAVFLFWIQSAYYSRWFQLWTHPSTDCLILLTAVFITPGATTF